MSQGTFDFPAATALVPVKLCECGCGEPAPIATKTSQQQGYAKGRPMRFVAGHYGKNGTSARILRTSSAEVPPAQVKLCECGCGQPAPIATMTNTKRGAVKGQPLRFVRGHRLAGMSAGPREHIRKLFVETGQRFGQSTVIDPEVTLLTRSKRPVRAVRLRYGCGLEYVRGISAMLKKPDAESCGGCIGYADPAGKQFGKLTVIRRVGKSPTSRWLCKCECKNEVTVLRSGLLNGHVRSCGCGKIGPRKGPTAVEVAFNSVLRKYQSSARERGITWSLSDDEFRRLTQLDCHYCGTAPATTRKTSRYFEGFVYNGVDRIDSSQAYRLGNVLPACGWCNWSKGTMSYAEFVKNLDRVAAYRASLNTETPGEMFGPAA